MQWMVGNVHAEYEPIDNTENNTVELFAVLYSCIKLVVSL